jgi:hypothetical protein
VIPHTEQQWQQLDGSKHNWLEGREPWLTLHAAIDDATNARVFILADVNPVGKHQ